MAELAAQGLVVEFSGLRALDGVTLTLRTGEVLGLIGPNGSGKTTLVNAITGQASLTAGEVVMNGQRLDGRAPRVIARAGISRSFQIARLFNSMTVRENVEAGALARGASRAEAEAVAEPLLADFGLAPRAEVLGATLSYGDKRRVEIARALAAQPSFLLLDEPAAGMNEAESEALLHILAAMPAARQLGLLIIDHDMALILRLCDQLHVIAAGRTIAEGLPAEVRTDPAVIEAYLGSEAAAHV